jgi:serine/threonine protein kinase
MISLLQEKEESSGQKTHTPSLADVSFPEPASHTGPNPFGLSTSLELADIGWKTYMHGRSLTHLDLKPQNVVISQAGEAVLIDVSGMAVTQEYLAPELRDVVEPAALDFHTRVTNDCWALGRIVDGTASIVEKVGNSKLSC